MPGTVYGMYAKPLEQTGERSGMVKVKLADILVIIIVVVVVLKGVK